jgi:ribose transport system ATP-binding protein
MRRVLEIRGMSKAFPGTLALDNVDFDVLEGEVHALVGQNGSGKSTLIKVLAGFHAAESGASVEVDGEPVKLGDGAASHAAGFRFVHQDLALVQDLSVLENLAFGRGFQRGFGGRILWKKEQKTAQALVESLGYDFDVREPVATLAAAEKTGVAIARALQDAEGARVLVLDEPTATLPTSEVEALFSAIRRVKQRGLGVVYVSHRLDEVFDIAQRVTVLRDGRRVGTWETKAIDENQLIELMTGGIPLKPPKATSPAHGSPRLEVHEVGGEALQSLSFSVRAGEVLGIAGLTGSGRDELLPLLFGAAHGRGRISVDGTAVPVSNPRAAKAAGLALVPADRHRHGGILLMSLEENVTLTDLQRHTSRGRLRHGRERAEVEDWLTKLDVRPPDAEAALDSLSGGNQQKIVLAKWLRTTPKVLLLDEPTQGVDVGAKASIHTLVRRAADEGAAVVVASSDDEEIEDTCDRVLVLRDGRLAGELVGDDVSMEALGRLQLTGASPTDGSSEPAG